MAGTVVKRDTNGRLLLDYIAFGGHTIVEAGPRRIDTAAAEAQAEMNRQ